MFRHKDRDQWSETLDFVKSLTGARFNSRLKFWLVRDLPHNREKLIKNGFVSQEEFCEKSQKKIERKKHDVNFDKSLVSFLRDYQMENLEFFERNNGRAICGDDMGIGKTVSALSYLKIHPDKKPVLIIATATTKSQWMREFFKWVNPNGYVEILAGKTPRKNLRDDVVYIINWEILFNWSGRKEKYIDQDGEEKIQYVWDGPLMKNNFEVIIADEIQAVGNSKSLRTKAFQKLGKKSPHLIALSGTPFKSGPWQFFTILNMIDRANFPNRWKYYERFCDLKFNGFGTDFKGATNLPALRDLVKDVMIRHTKKDVLKELPDKVRTVIPLDGQNRSDYDERFLTLLKKGITFWDIEDLNDNIFQYKADEVITWIEEFLESGEKLLVFAWHRSVVDLLHKAFSKCAVKLYGGISGSKKDDVINSFINNPRKKLLLSNLIAGGVGIDGLQNVCSNVAKVELFFNPADHWQAEDRLHRMGQKNSVNCYYLLMKNSVEMDIMEIFDNKSKVYHKIMNGEESGEIDVLGELMKKYKGE